MAECKWSLCDGLSQRTSKGLHMVQTAGPFNARYLLLDDNRRPIKDIRYTGETGWMDAQRDFMDDVINAVHGIPT